MKVPSDQMDSLISMLGEPRPELIGYLRVSTREQGDSGAGLDAQRHAILTAHPAVTRFCQDVESGRSVNRPGLQAALTACRSGEASGIVVAKLDRLSRSLQHFAGLMEQARREGWNVIALDLNIDLQSPAGELIASVMAAVAQWEARAIGERTKDGLAAKKAQGVQLGRPRSIPEPVRERVRELLSDDWTCGQVSAFMGRAGVPMAASSVGRIGQEAR